MSRIGDMIKEERVKQRISPKQLGKKCGVSESFIIEVESGRKIINEKMIEQLSKALGKNLDEKIMEEPKEEVLEEKKITKRMEPIPQKREEVTPLGQWEDALSNIIKNIPIYDIERRNLKGHRSFPIIDRKVEGFNPDKLIYIEILDDAMRGFHISKGDRVLVYLNHELENHSFVLAEYDGKTHLRRAKRVDGNKIELTAFGDEMKTIKKDLKDIKIIGRGIRVEITL